MTPEEREVSFFHKRLGQRAAIVAAGPIANFLFAIIGLTLLFSLYGQPFTPADIGSIQPDSAAAQAGMQPGDVIVEVDGQPIERFEEVQQIVRFNQGTPLALVVQRDGQRLPITATPQVTTVTDRMGNSHTIGLLGIGRAGMEYRRHDPLTALWQAGRETVNLTAGTLGRRRTDDRRVTRHRGTGRTAAHRANVGRSGAKRHGRADLVHGDSVGQSWADKPFPHPDAGRRPLVVLCR